MRKSTIPLIISIAVAAGFSYLLFRTVLEESEAQHPITFELYAALIGVSITVILTSILLKRQTGAELRKEENVMFLELKMKTYTELIEQLQDIISKKNVLEEDMIEIRLLNQKLTFIGSEEVLIAFNSFSQCFAKVALKDGIDDDDIDSLLEELSELSVFIRKDLMSTAPRKLDSETKIREAVRRSNKNLDIE